MVNGKHVPEHTGLRPHRRAYNIKLLLYAPSNVISSFIALGPGSDLCFAEPHRAAPESTIAIRVIM